MQLEAGTLGGGAEAAEISSKKELPLADVDHRPASEVSEDERIRRLEELIGQPTDSAQIFADAIREHCRQGWDKWVHPLFVEHWPEAIGEGAPFEKDYKKLRFLACNLYASAPYTVLFCASKPHWVVKLATGLGNGLRLSPSGLNTGASVALSLFARLFSSADQKRILMIASFIATIDHAFDHYMDELAPKERERRIKGLLEGTWEPDHGSLKLTRALTVAMSEGVRPEEQKDFDAALERVKEWVESEVSGMEGAEDPKGLCWRLAGVEGTIDGLIFPVLRYAGEDARQWMYDVSLFTQMMDDWIDYEADMRDIRPTPVIEGRWNLAVIKAKWDDTVEGIEKLARGAGMKSESYQTFVRDAYVYMMQDVMRAMIHGVAA